MRSQRGALLLVMLLTLGVVGAYLTLRAFNGLSLERSQASTTAMAQAKEALIGYAATYADTHGGLTQGYLPLPDLGTSRSIAPGEGSAAANFAGNAQELTVLGRLPWKTLDLAPLRDSQGECLWYAVSGSHQNALPSASPLNWDTLGLFDTYRSDGTAAGTVSTVGANVHQRPIAVIFAAGEVLPGQDRTASPVDAVTQCGGNYDARNYLDSVNPNPLLNNIVNYLGAVNASTGVYNLAAPKQLILGPVLDANRVTMTNDRLLPITTDELFRVIKKRSDFKTDIDTMVADLSACLNAMAVLPATSIGNKGVDLMLAACPAVAQRQAAVLGNWRNNLLYTHPAAVSSVNGVGGCAALLLFAGERTARSVAPAGSQLRATPAQTGSAAWFGDAAMYLEGPNTVFPASGAYTGAGFYSAAAASADVVRCIKGLPAGAMQQSFARDLGNFVPVGAAVRVDAASQSVALGSAAGAGACLWSPTAIALSGKTLRAYYEYKFSQPDAFALTTLGSDLGNGFTLQFVTANPGEPPAGCGSAAAMGTLGPADAWGGHSIIVETDLHRDPADADPLENHSALLRNGSLDHTQGGASMSASCDGSAAGCRHSPANQFEEAPTAPHRQRIEIHSGCDALCTVCEQLPVTAPNDHVGVIAWVDCSDCSDVVSDLDRAAHRPTMQRCMSADPALNSVYYGFTGGFPGGANTQAVSLGRLILRSE